MLHDLQIVRDAKQKFGLTCHGVLLVGPALGHTGMKNAALTFHTLDAPERAT
jgi:hypothetical protein